MENQSQRKIRQSNFELARILAMFMVLIVHADIFTFGEPTYDLLHKNFDFAFGQYLFQSTAIGCVNIFILISGWFGIRSNLKSFCNLVFQVLFFSLGLSIIHLFNIHENINIKVILTEIGSSISLFHFHSYWFIKAYIGLYIFAPILNIFIENAQKKGIERFLISFYFFQTLFSWLINSAVFFVDGYGPLSFMGLYILARYIRLYPNKYTRHSKEKDLFIFILCVLTLTFTFLICTELTVFSSIPKKILDKLCFYTNPIVILMSVFLILFFSKLKIQNNYINKISCSCLAVYLLHQHKHIIEYFISHIIYISDNYNSIYFLIIIFLYLIGIFILAILIDQIRLFLWRKLMNITLNCNYFNKHK